MFIKTKLETLIRIAGGASDDDTRYYICGVNIHKRPRMPGVVLEATNGHIVAIEHDADGDCSTDNPHSLVVRTDCVKLLKAAGTKAAKAWKVALSDVSVEISAAGIVAHYVLTAGEATTGDVTLGYPDNLPFIDCQFPDVERVIPILAPDAAPHTSDSYNALLLVQLAKTARNDKSGLPFVLYSPGIGSAARMRVSGAPNWLGVIMPMRVDGDSTIAAPAWYFDEGAKLHVVAVE